MTTDTAASAQVLELPIPATFGPETAWLWSTAAAELGAGGRCARHLLALLLRLHGKGRTPELIERSEGWLSSELGYCERQVRRAVRALESTNLLHLVRRGTGHDSAVYRLNLRLMRATVTRVKGAVHPGESQGSEGGRDVRPGRTASPPWGDAKSPQGGRDVRPVRARAYTRASLDPLNYPPSPTGQVDERAPESPAASGGDPLPSTSASEKCPHGRSRRQPCRQCGTDLRTQRREANRAAHAAARAAAAAERARAQQADAVEAAPPPPNWRPPRASRSSPDRRPALPGSTRPHPPEDPS